MSRVSNGAKRRALRTPGDYYFGDMKHQTAVLKIRIASLNDGQVVKIDTDAAIRKMVKRVTTFYGITNKYPRKQEA